MYSLTQQFNETSLQNWSLKESYIYVNAMHVTGFEFA